MLQDGSVPRRRITAPFNKRFVRRRHAARELAKGLPASQEGPYVIIKEGLSGDTLGELRVVGTVPIVPGLSRLYFRDDKDAQRFLGYCRMCRIKPTGYWVPLPPN